jgi:two-component system sensor histidine kinase GlrK
MLIGFTIVAAPLLFAIVNAAVQMNRLSNRSEQLVNHGMQGTRNNQKMFEEIGALERTARLYQIIGNTELLDVYNRNHGRLVATLDDLLTLPLDAQAKEDARALRTEADRLSAGLKASPPNSPKMAEFINAYPQMAEMASS